MSDPFANLLTSFKESNTQKRSLQNDIRKTVLQPVQRNINCNIPSLSSIPLVPSSNIKGDDSIHDDLADLFGLSSTANNVNTNSSAMSNTNADDLMAAFDNFDNAPKQSDIQEDQYLEDQEVIDEVKDMEVARLMSLGFTIEKATRFYDKNILYEDVVAKRVDKSQRENTQANDRGDMTFFNERNTNTQHTSGPSLFSMATGFLNKGKEFVDQLTAYPGEESNRMSKYRETDETGFADTDRFKSMNHNTFNEENNGFLMDDNNDAGSDGNPFENELSATPSAHTQPDVIEGDLLGDFGKKLNITRETINTRNDRKSPEGSTLLDFDSETTTSTNTDSTILRVQITPIELSGYNEFNNNAKEFFTNGDYNSALQEYEKSLNTLPQTHPLRVIALSNIMISQIKIGEYSKCTENAVIAIALFPSDKQSWKSNIQDSDPVKTYKDIWSKIVLRQAEAFEHLENYKNALAAYEVLMDNGIHDHKIMNAKRRCQNVINPPDIVKPKVAPVLTKTQQIQTPKIVTPPQDQKTYESVEKIKQTNKKDDEIDAQKLVLHDRVFDKIEAWKSNKQDDIRFLLSNLSTILIWTDWKSVSTSELVVPKKVKITYLKAIAKIHPDKLPESLDLEYKMLAENMFSVLSLAWNKFREENNIA